jgi:hypothetical protein
VARLVLAVALVVLVVVASIFAFVVWYEAQPEKFTVLFGDSMDPTLDTFDVVYFRTARTIQRGDITPYRGTLHRVAILAGETFEVHHGTVTINSPGISHVLVEPYVHSNFDWDWPRTTLGPAQYALLGDNRTVPASRYPIIAAQVDLDRILDRRVFPFWRTRSW